MRICQNCGAEFTPKDERRNRPPARYCSRSCGVTAAQARRPPAVPWQERFARHVAPTTPTACWEWQGMRDAEGYGRLMLTKTPFRTIQAHRAAWTISNGEIADGLMVCHRCDNRACVNAAHLFLGTQTENVADMDKKGRRRPAHGPSNGATRYSTEQVAEVRRLVAAGLTQGQISRATGVSVDVVKNVRSGRSRRNG